MNKKILTALGLMTGTSMDGVDLSIIKSDGYNEFHCIFNEYYEFNKELRLKLINLRSKFKTKNDLLVLKNEIDDLEREFTLYNGQIVNNLSKDKKKEIDLVGFHGQTIYHNSKEKISKQLGNGKLLSQITKKIIINNFRKNDIENGGQGAPLSPIFHELISKKIFESHKIKFPIIFLNIGGISNITIINFDYHNKKSQFYAYDIGPGNCLIDEWMKKNNSKSFDLGGNISKSGNVDKLILNQIVDNFEIKSYDKSLDISEFDLSFAKGLSLEDGGATITKFTAYLIAKGIDKLSKLNNLLPKQIFVCGGGRKNIFLIDSISEFLSNKNFKIDNIDDFNYDGDFIESQAFGYLAIRSFLGLPISFPNTTRCKKPLTGGTLIKNF